MTFYGDIPNEQQTKIILEQVINTRSILYNHSQKGNCECSSIYNSSNKEKHSGNNQERKEHMTVVSTFAALIKH